MAKTPAQVANIAKLATKQLKTRNGFFGNKGFELKNAKYQKVRNNPRTIQGRSYGGHALDQMQNRGFTPSIIEETIQSRVGSPNKVTGRMQFYDPVKLMILLNEYDLKQIKLIEKRIILFENNKMELFDFVSDLRGLLNAIESIGDPWKDDFQAEINSLEMIQDSIEDGSISRWKGSFKEDVHKSISKLKKMTTLLLEKYLKISDPNIQESAIEANSKWLMCPKCNDAWESNSLDAMVVCPKCDCAFHNPRASQK